jgi:cell division protein FtsQ
MGVVMAWFVLTIPYFCITRVEVKGQERLSKDIILKWAAIPKQSSIFRVNLKDVSERITSASRVKKTEVRRVFPSTLLILIEERSPFAYLKKGSRIFEIDEEGVIIGEAVKKQHLPLITGAGVSPDKTQRIEMGVKVLASFQKWGLPLSRIDIVNENCLVGYLEKGPRVYLREDHDLGYLSCLSLILSDAKRAGKRVEYLDLRFNQQVVVGYE